MNQARGQKSPHKVAMLLSVIDLIQAGYIYSNKIVLDKQLKERFSEVFSQIKLPGDCDTPELPFFHLRSEGFWHIQYRDGIAAVSVTRFSKSKIDYAYLDDELFKILKSPISSIAIRDVLCTNLSDLSTRFARWLVETGRSESTAQKYVQAIRGSISNWLAQDADEAVLLSQAQSYSNLKQLANRARDLDEFKIRNERGNGMYSAALNSYEQFVCDLMQIDVQADISQLMNDEHLDATERSVMINARVGQGIFRKKLIDMWHGCAVTRYQNTQLLMASHIKPWRSSTNDERLNPYNGLLLTANLDKAFDLGFISFRNTGKILIASCLEKPQALGIDEDMSFAASRDHRCFLEHHRAVVFKGLSPCRYA